MPFNDFNPADDGAAGSQLQSRALAAGLSNIQDLSQLGQVQAILTALLVGAPAWELFAGALASSPLLGIGYKTGAGGVVTQATNRSAPVTLNTVVGAITGNAASLSVNQSAQFTVVNSVVAVDDVIELSVRSGPTAATSIFSVVGVAAGAFVVRAHNVSTGTGDVGAPILNFAVIKGAVA